MTAVHDSDHVARLRSVFEEDLEESDAEVQRQLASCADCRAEFDGLRKAQVIIEKAAEEERELLGSLDRTRRDPRIDDFVRARLAERGAPPGPTPLAPPALVRRPAAAPRSRTWWIAAAAAAILAGTWLAKLLLDRGAQPSRSPVLGQDEDAGLSPSGKVASYTPLTWKLTLQPGEHFEVVVWDDTEGAQVDPIDRAELDDNRWIADSSKWPARIRWEVRVIDATGEPLRRERAQAEL